jgi:phosphoribosylglycinamide formyltransferase 1
MYLLPGLRQGLSDEDNQSEGRQMNIAVFASGRGTNFSAIASAVKRGKIKARLALVVCDNPRAGVIGRAWKAGVEVMIIKREDFADKDGYEKEIVARLRQEKISLVVLAGYMRIVGKLLLGAYKNRMINIHPALLPSFKGCQGIKDAFDYGVKVTGATVHFVDDKMDNGPIILQAAVPIAEKDTLAALEEKIHRVEHKLYPEAVRLFCAGKLKIRGRKVRIIR